MPGLRAKSIKNFSMPRNCQAISKRSIKTKKDELPITETTQLDSESINETDKEDKEADFSTPVSSPVRKKTTSPPSAISQKIQERLKHLKKLKKHYLQRNPN